MEFHLIAFEGPIGISKTEVVRRVAERLDATTVLDEAAQNPFLSSFYEGKAGAALQTELFFLLSRYRQQQELIQRRLFSGPTLVDYVFERSKLFACLNLDDNELLIFDKLFSLLTESVPRPDLVVYLQAPLQSLTRRVRERGRAEETHLSEEYVAEVNQAYNYYFFHYTQTPLLVVNVADVDLVGRTEDLDDLVKQIRQMGKGTRYYVPLGSKR
jgi:deoxyguanosine kinase